MTTATRDLFNQPMNHKYRGATHYMVLGLAVVALIAMVQLGIAGIAGGPRATAFTGFTTENTSLAARY